ncbi:MAG TPA: hypothetical protein VK860_03215 [Ilumatobacteraceae bacterium]|jgi:hypothetical protein|nr:hypothetical protein [Ilumatobacteraceae bacterium]
MTTNAEHPATSATDFRDRVIEVLTVVLLGVATVASAWCAYQASRWNGIETDEARATTEARVEQARLFATGTQVGSYDSNVLLAYAQAEASGQPTLAEFIRTTLMRPEFEPVLQTWEQEVRADTAQLSPIPANEDYTAALFAGATAAEQSAVEASERAADAGSNAEAYLLTTLFMASALFFAGVVSSFASRGPRIALLTMSMVMLAAGAARIVELPIG